MALSGTDTGTIVDVARVALAIGALAFASWTDLRTRKVPNVLWYVTAGLAAAILLIDLSRVEDGGAWDLALAFPVVAVYAVVAGACGLVATVGSGQFVAMLPPYVSLGGWQILNMKVAFLITTVLRFVSHVPMYLVKEPRAVPFHRMMRAVAADARLWLLRFRPGPGK